MFRQFWTDCLLVFGLAGLAFAGFALPDWMILEPGISSDAIPLSILLFFNEYGAILLALAAFRTGAFLPFKVGRTVPGHLVLTALFLAIMISSLVVSAELWHARLAKGHQRIALLEQQSLQRSLTREPSRIFPRALLFMPVSLPTNRINHATLISGSRILHSGSLLVEPWAITNAIVLTTNARHAPWSPLPGNIDALMPRLHPSLISASFDARLAKIFRWPMVHPASEPGAIPGHVGFLAGIALFASGCGLFLNRMTLSLYHRIMAYCAFLALLVIPVWLFHLWWLAKSSSATLSTNTHCLLRALVILIPGVLVFSLGFIRRRRLEARITR